MDCSFIKKEILNLEEDEDCTKSEQLKNVEFIDVSIKEEVLEVEEYPYCEPIFVETESDDFECVKEEANLDLDEINFSDETLTQNSHPAKTVTEDKQDYPKIKSPYKNLMKPKNVDKERGRKKNKSEIDSTFITRIKSSKYPIVLVKKLDNRERITRLTEEESDSEDIQSFTCDENGSLVPVQKGKSNPKPTPDRMRREMVSSGTGKIFVKMEFECGEEDSSRDFNSAVESQMFESSDYDYDANHEIDLESLLTIGSGNKPFKCTQCSYESKYRWALKTHYLTHFGTKQLKCSECSYATNYKRALDIHLLTHSGIKKLQCPQCDYQSNYRTVLNTHLLTHSGDKPFKCSECRYATIYKSDLKLHSLSHTGTKKYKCSHCKYRSNDKSNLRFHILSHSPKEFKCTHCSYETNDKRGFNRHMLTHLDVKLFKCSLCNYGANDKGNLNIHILNHSGTKRFKCPHCSYQTNDKHGLNRHSLTHSKIKRFKCSQCSYAFTQGAHLKRHLYLVHKKSAKSS